MQCPNCQATVNLRHINQGNIQGLQVQFTCPSCSQVLSVNTKATFSKLIGALVALVSGGVMIWGLRLFFMGQPAVVSPALPWRWSPAIKNARYQSLRPRPPALMVPN